MILIAAAGGKLGREILDVLAADEAAGQLIAGLRSPEKAEDLVQRGIAVREMDFDRPETLGPALEGVEKLVLIPSPAPPEQRIKQHRNVIAAAEKARIGHFIFIGFQDSRHASPLPYGKIFADTESRLRDSRLKWTVLRMPLYADSILQWLADAHETGEIFASAGDGRVPFLSRRDIALCVRAVLQGNGHGGKTYELTGPECLGYEDIVDLGAEIYGLNIAYVSISAKEHRRRLEAAGVEPPYIDGAIGMAAVQREGYFDNLTKDVERLIGRPGETVRRFLERHRLPLEAPSKN